MAAVRYFTVLVRDDFLFGPFLDNRSGIRSSKIQWGKKTKGEELKKTTEKKKKKSTVKAVVFVLKLFQGSVPIKAI